MVRARRYDAYAAAVVANLRGFAPACALLLRADMARPHARDLFTWVCTLPASTVLVVCLFLPQVKDCNGRVQTPVDTNTWPLMIIVALIGVLPIAWRWPSLRQPILAFVGMLTAAVLIVSVIGIVALVLIAFVKRLREEELAALCSFGLVLAFLIVFPLVGLFATWRIGGELTWAAAWLQLIGMLGWAFAAARR